MTFRARAIVIGLAVATLTACGGSRGAPGSNPSETQPSDQLASAGLPELATIGGAQDIWPFAFGLDASREDVRAQRGEPTSTAERPAGTGSVDTSVVTWEYPDAVFTFFVDRSVETDDLLSASVRSQAVPLRGGLSVGMSPAAAREILGEPNVEEEGFAAWFYFTSTIELFWDEEAVNEIVLARALP
jgi:hypothetical protein